MDTVSLVTSEKIQRQQLEETRKTFIATLTHDLKSPIMAEQKALEFMFLKKPDYVNGTYEECLHDIYKTNEDLLKLVNNLLAIYQYELGKFQLNKKFESIEEIIHNSARSLKYLAEDRQVQIDFNIEENLPLISFDKDEINRVLTNLMSNAIKNTDRNTRVLASAFKTDGYLQVSVKDEGQGIPKSQIPKIFHRYPTEKQKIGSGLGLYNSKQIIEAHKGKIWFETQEGAGTTFYFTLPAS